ncbi:MAG: hypothetical protein LBR51_05540 [Bacteroidales bacterium]|jgi:hypothetical protein|nr:hypothetical protein [Bacteroidales bacterium]
MKKIMMIAVAAMFVFASCGNKPKADEVVAEGTPQEETPCCKEMTEEQKADCADWKNWENLTPERQDELLLKSKECIDKKMAECAEKCEGKEEPACPEAKAKCEAFKASWENWENLEKEAKKALIDEFRANCCKAKKCCKKEAEEK